MTEQLYDEKLAIPNRESSVSSWTRIHTTKSTISSPWRTCYGPKTV